MAQEVSTADLRDEGRAKQFYDERYQEGYMQDWWPDAKKRRVVQVLRSLGLPETGLAIDFGCGDGVFTDLIHRALPGWEAWGTDLSDVAVGKARARFPACRFCSSDELARSGQLFDLLFTHHVLEHVSDLPATLRRMAAMTKDLSAMVHILPCGNTGSLERQICELRTDGIDPALDDRFFYEDPGHLRRLTTDRLADHLSPHGFKLVRGYYAYQYWGAIDYFTGQEPYLVASLTDLAHARDAGARRRLRRLVGPLRRVAACRRMVRRYEKWRYRSRRPLHQYLAMAVCLPAYVPCKLVDRSVRRRACNEWDRCRDNPGGSEMYLTFRRGPWPGHSGDERGA